MFCRIRYLEAEQRLDIELITEYFESLTQCRTLRDIQDFDGIIAENLVSLWFLDVEESLEVP